MFIRCRAILYQIFKGGRYKNITDEISYTTPDGCLTQQTPDLKEEEKLSLYILSIQFMLPMASS